MRATVYLDEVANDVCVALGDTSYNNKITVTRHLIDCYRDFSIYIGCDLNIVTKCLPYGNTINLPKDFIYETKVGVKVNGKIAILKLDSTRRLDNMNDTECRNYLSQVWDGEYFGECFTFHNHSGKGEMYGCGRGVANPGTFNINRKDGIIELGSHIPHDAEIIVEYVSDLVSSDGLKLIPIEAKKFHEYYALSEMYMGAKFSNITKSQISRNNYERDFGKTKRLYRHRDPQQVIDAINAAFSPTNY